MAYACCMHSFVIKSYTYGILKAWLASWVSNE